MFQTHGPENVSPVATTCTARCVPHRKVLAGWLKYTYLWQFGYTAVRKWTFILPLMSHSERSSTVGRPPLDS